MENINQLKGSNYYLHPPDGYLEKGTVVESGVFEDLTRMDYLESQLIKLKRNV